MNSKYQLQQESTSQVTEEELCNEVVATYLKVHFKVLKQHTPHILLKIAQITSESLRFSLEITGEVSSEN